jgi:hypothetical protein
MSSILATWGDDHGSGGSEELADIWAFYVAVDRVCEAENIERPKPLAIRNAWDECLDNGEAWIKTQGSRICLRLSVDDSRLTMKD